MLKGKTEAIPAFEPISEHAADSAFVVRYCEAFDLLSREDAAAKDLFEQLKLEYPEDPLVNLHYQRLTSGILSPIIVLAEK